MEKRKGINPKVKFEVFKRDNFTCQYCGAKAPDVLLEIDHINPVSNGGDNEILNLITSCFECNRGKGKTLLSDNTMLEKQRVQMEELNERRLQIEMMLQWKMELMDIKYIELNKIVEYVENKLGDNLNQESKNHINTAIKKSGSGKVLDAIDIIFNKQAQITKSYFEQSVGKISGIIHLSDKPEYTQKIYYIKGICKNKFPNLMSDKFVTELTKCYELGINLDKLRDSIIKNNFKDLHELMEHLNNFLMQKRRLDWHKKKIEQMKVKPNKKG